MSQKIKKRYILNQNSIQIQKKGNFWSKTTSKIDQNWLLGEMTLKLFKCKKNIRKMNTLDFY